jgi:hypothetical protein
LSLPQQRGTLMPHSSASMPKPAVFSMPFARIYPLYIQKAERKGRTRDEVDQILLWLTGHDANSLEQAIDAQVDLESFLERAPRFHPNASKVSGVVCGVRVEAVEDPLMQKIRYLDKLVDELAKGRKMAKVLR